MEAIKHKPWENDRIRSTASKIEKAQDRARGEHGTDRSRRKLQLLLDAVEMCSKLHPLVAKAVGSERSLMVEANNDFEQNRTPNEYVDVLERWENRLIKAAGNVGVDCCCIPQGLQSQIDNEVFDRVLGKVDELHDKLDKMEKEKCARKRSVGGKVNYVDEEEAEEEGIMAVEYGGMADERPHEEVHVQIRTNHGIRWIPQRMLGAGKARVGPTQQRRYPQETGWGLEQPQAALKCIPRLRVGRAPCTRGKTSGNQKVHTQHKRPTRQHTYQRRHSKHRAHRKVDMGRGATQAGKASIKATVCRWEYESIVAATPIVTFLH